MPGDFPEFEKMIATVNEFARGNAQLRLGRAIANEAVAQSLMCFRESRDPYGNTWLPLKHRSGKPLLDTGRLRSSIAIQDVTPTSFRIGSNVRYASVHQNGYDGTYHRKARSTNMAIGKKGRFLSRKKASVVVDPAAKLRKAGVEQHVIDLIFARSEQGWSAKKISEHIGDIHRRAVSASTIRQATKPIAAIGFRRLNFTARGIHMEIPPRPFLPKGTLGPIWSKAFVAAGSATLLRILKR